MAYFLARLDQRKPLSAERREAAERLAVAALVVILLAGGGMLVARGAGPSRLLHDFTHSASPKVGNSPSRLTVLSSSSRSAWWRESWRAFKAHPVDGTGAGSFELVDRRYRKSRGLALEPHSLPLQFLSETGIVGFLLGAGATVAGLLAIFERRRREGAEAAAAAALTVVPIAYLLHGLLDFDWDFLAVSAPLFLVIGVLIARDAPARESKARALWAAGAALLACAAIYSLAAPWLAVRKVDDAFAALGRGSPRAAAADARDAHDLNPLALEPLFAWAAAETLQGNDVEAEKLYMRAVRLQPLNSRSWFELGRFELAHGGAQQGRVFLRRAAQLDPQGPREVVPLVADDDDDVRPAERGRAQAVQRSDDLDAEVVRKAERLAAETGSVHDDGGSVAGLGRVADGADLVAVPAHDRGLRGGGALAAVSVQDEDDGAAAREVRNG